MPGGRPTTYTKELGALICDRIGDGDNLKNICEPDDMPNRSTVYLWIGTHPEFSNMYAKAQEDRAESLVDDMFSIADNLTGDTARDKLRVDTRKWAASKLLPKKYGDKVEQVHTGGIKVASITLSAPDLALPEDDG